MIEVTGLRKSFKNHAVLKGLDFHVDSGGVYGFLGLNGAGKTTTMNILTGVSGFDTGLCTVCGVRLDGKTRMSIPNIAYLPENPSLYPFMTGREYLLYIAGAGKLSARETSRRAEAMLELSGMKAAAGRRIGGYSRGMRQRLGIGAALLHDPKLVFLDEPTSALDPEGRQAVLNMILNLRDEGRTVFLSTHLLDDAERVCDRVGIILNGKVVLDETLETLHKTHMLPLVDITFAQRPSDEEIAVLSAVEGIRRIERTDEAAAAAYLSSEEAGDSLFRVLSGMPLRVLGFQRRRSNLQEIFLQVSKEKEA
jgi:ABC-2 type transport system ATP-binding protein